MSEIEQQPKPTALLQAEARHDWQVQFLHQTEVMLDTQSSLYEPEEIGIPRQLASGEEIEVIGEAAIGGDGRAFGEMAFVRSNTPDRNDFFWSSLPKMKVASQRPLASGSP